MPELNGWYVYADFCSGRIWAVNTADDSPPLLLTETGLPIVAFGELPDGELLALTFPNAVYRLQRTTVESESPLTKEKIRLTVSPQRVEESNPAGAVVSIVVMDPDKADMSSAQAIWGTFCHHIFFFASREEAEQWAAGRDDIEILSLDEGFELGKQFWSKVLAYV